MRIQTLALYTALCVLPSLATAQQPPQKDWRVSVGAGPVVTPAFVGSDDYYLLAVPNVRLNYKDTFFASFEEGVGYNAINKNGWRAGPIFRWQMGREEDGDNFFRVAGDETNALRGLGDVDDTPELGGFVEYTWATWSAKAEVRQGLGGHDGAIGDVSMRYTNHSGHTVYGLGPKMRFVSDDYNDAYFGVNAAQSARSGLSQYSPEGGLLSYGLNGFVRHPFSEALSVTGFAGYDRLAGDAADAPLVEERGSENQFMLGATLNYEFGW